MMKYYTDKVVDRQVGRNAELFAQTIATFDSSEKRYPYVRILISIIEQAHPEWAQAPTKDRRIAHLAHSLSHRHLAEDEVADVVRIRDRERGFVYD